MHSIAWWPTLIVLVVATFIDLLSRRIPNWLVFPFMIAGMAVSGWLIYGSKLHTVLPVGLIGLLFEFLA